RALIGFAGPRTIKATIRVDLPPGFQTSEFLLEHGFVDRIVHRRQLRSEVARIIDYCSR
ncbi:MAG: acetyl-CoA carboxylase carboxyl transferase subunit beta, partial [Planctomycetaceae bacterium]